MRCGAWATKRPNRLLRPCRQTAVTTAVAQALKRAHMGLHPTAPLGEAEIHAHRPIPLRAALEGRATWSATLREAKMG